MAWLKSFAAFVLLQVVLWGGAHVYLTGAPKDVLLVVDTSYAMKPHFTDARTWIDDLADSSRYTRIEVGTEKAKLGDLEELSSRDNLFRTSFGKLSQENMLNLYKGNDATKKYLLTSEAISIDGWQVVSW